MASLTRALRPWVHRLTGPAEVTATLFDGQRLTVVVPEIVGTALYRRGIIEEPLTELLRAHLRPGMVFVDVGAQYGYFTVLASRLVGPSGRVVAFEPCRATAALLRRNVAGSPNVVVEECAVSSRSGTVPLRDFGPGHSAVNTVLGEARVPRRERRRLRGCSYDVPAVALDDYGLSRVDAVKIDAEGAETEVLRGMGRLLSATGPAPLVAIETGDYDGMVSPATAASIDLLESVGYRGFDYVPGEGLQPHRRQASYGYGNLFFLKN